MHIAHDHVLLFNQTLSFHAHKDCTMPVCHYSETCLLGDRAASAITTGEKSPFRSLCESYMLCSWAPPCICAEHSSIDQGSVLGAKGDGPGKPAEAYVMRFWMAHYGHHCPKRTVCYSNGGFVAHLDAGTLTKNDRLSCTLQTASLLPRHCELVATIQTIDNIYFFGLSSEANMWTSQALSNGKAIANNCEIQRAPGCVCQRHQINL